jgi:hypothetical protein
MARPSVFTGITCKRDPRRTRVSLANSLVISLLALGIASCSSGSSVASGHGSPEEAVQGFINALNTNSVNNGSFCQWLEPSAVSECQSGLEGLKSQGTVDITTNTLSIRSDVIDGTRALVSLTGQLCSSGGNCTDNTDSNSGMPSASTSFDEAYSDAEANTQTTISPVACAKVGGTWYVAVSFFGGTTPTTAPPSPTTTPTTVPATTTPTTTPTTIPGTTPTTSTSPPTTTAP